MQQVANQLLRNTSDETIRKAANEIAKETNKIAIDFYRKNDFKVLKSISNYYCNLECNHAYFMCYK